MRNHVRTTVRPCRIACPTRCNHVTIRQRPCDNDIVSMAARLVLIPLPMSESPRFDVSVILPFGDDEELVGIAVRRTAEHLRGLGLSFEILAIDEDSRRQLARRPRAAARRGPRASRHARAGSRPGRRCRRRSRAGHAARSSRRPMSRALRSTVSATRAAACSPVKATPRSRSLGSRSLIAFARSSRSAARASSVAAMHRRLAKRLQVRNLSVRVAGPTGVAAKTAVGRLRAFAARGNRVASPTGAPRDRAAIIRGRHVTRCSRSCRSGF